MPYSGGISPGTRDGRKVGCLGQGLSPAAGGGRGGGATRRGGEGGKTFDRGLGSCEKVMKKVRISTPIGFTTGLQ